jgi:acetate CoA/acetoacetate CoA-transferase alpha subunit
MGKVIEMSEIGKFLKDGMTISIGGFLGCGNAHNIIDEILKTNVKNLTLVSSDTVKDGQGIGKLIADNRISKLMATHIGTNKDTQRQVNEGLIELELIPQGTLAERLRSAAAGLGGVLTRTGIGTLVQEGKEVIHIDGKDYILEKPIHLDLAIVKAQKADKSGNLIYNGATRNFNVPMAGAAKVTIAEVEEIVENGELNPNFIHTPFVYINHIVKA